MEAEVGIALTLHLRLALMLNPADPPANTAAAKDARTTLALQRSWNIILCSY